MARVPLRDLAIVTDYDGALAPIIDDPARAVPLPAARDALAALVGECALVAVVSGRPVAFLREQLALDGVVLVGQYGLERAAVDGSIVVDPRATVYARAISDAAADAERAWPELLVERKGDITVTVHWRLAPQHAPPDGALGELADRHGLALHRGRMSCELRPPVAIDKGTVLESIFESHLSLRAAAFIGDDHGDLVAFDALDRLERRHRDEGTGFVATRVAVRSPEVPPELLERADLIVDGPAGVADLLRSVLPP